MCTLAGKAIIIDRLQHAIAGLVELKTVESFKLVHTDAIDGSSIDDRPTIKVAKFPNFVFAAAMMKRQLEMGRSKLLSWPAATGTGVPNTVAMGQLSEACTGCHHQDDANKCSRRTDSGQAVSILQNMLSLANLQV